MTAICGAFGRCPNAPSATTGLAKLHPCFDWIGGTAVVTAPAPRPTLGRSTRQVLRSLLLPAGWCALAIVIAAVAGHVAVGLLIATGIALGAVNGVLADAATARLTPDDDPTRGMIIGGSMRRLGAITLIALAIAWLARPTGWTVLLGLAFYQILSLLAVLSTAAREARRA